MIMTILNQDLIEKCVQGVPLLLCLVLYWLSGLLWPDRGRFLRYWMTLCNLVICSLLLGLPSFWIFEAPTIAAQIIYGFIGVTCILSGTVIFSSFANSFQSVPESRLFFRGLQLCKSIMLSFIIALFIFFSLPSVSLAATALIVGATFSGSVVLFHGLDRSHEDRSYLRHLLMLGLRDASPKPSVYRPRIHDSALQYIVSGLRLLYQPLESTSLSYNGNSIHLSNALRMLDPIDVFHTPPMGWIRGALAHKSLLETENHRFYDFLKGNEISSSGLFGGSKASMSKDSLIVLSNFDSMLDLNLENNFKRNRIELLSFSPHLFEVFSILGNWTAEKGPLFITGPSGSGRRTLANATLKKIGCKDVLMFDVLNIHDEFSLVNNLEELFEGRTYTGAVIVNTERLSKNSWDLIQSILIRNHVKYAIALIGDESLLQHVNLENATVARLSPLHERIEDLFFQTIYFSRQACRELGVTNLAIDYQAVQELLRIEFPENSRTLRNFCFEAVQAAKNKKIISFIHGSGKQLRSSMI